MPTATNPNTTSTRRSAIGFSAAALLAGLTTPVLAKGVKNLLSYQTPTRKLIAACDQLVAVETEFYLLLDHDEYVSDYGPNHSRYEKLLGERDRLTDLIDDCESPTTTAGHVAVARAAITWSTIDIEGNIECHDFHDDLMLALAQGVAPDFVWPPRPGGCSTAHWAPPTSAKEIAEHNAAHDAWVASVDAKIQAGKEAKEAEDRRLDTPALLTDDELRGRFKAALRFKDVADRAYAELADEAARRMLVAA